MKLSSLASALSLACVFALGSAQAADSAEAALRQAELLLKEGKPADAYALLAPLEAELAGGSDFDYLYSLAALDSGRPAEAAFGLERVLAADPTFAGARMELARAQYESGDYDGARTQFNYLLTQSPPAATRTVIERYLAAIDGRRAAARSGGNFFVQFGAGYDSNANASTADQTFLGFTLDSKNVESSSAYFEAALGGNYGVQLGTASALVLNGRLSHRANPDARFVDQSIASGGATLLFTFGGWRASAGLSGYAGWLDGESHERGGGIDLGLTRSLGQQWELSGMVRAGLVRFEEDALEIMDVNRYLGAVSLTYSARNERAGKLSVSLLGGQDDARRDGSAYGNDRYGARVSGSVLMTPNSSFYAEVMGQKVDYDDSPGFFGIDRSDDQYSGAIVLQFQNLPARGWSFEPRVRYVKNDSNVPLYAYDRWEAGLFVRRDFR